MALPPRGRRYFAPPVPPYYGPPLGQGPYPTPREIGGMKMPVPQPPPRPLTPYEIEQFFPRREEGGPVEAGKPYIVGEAGPEVFIPAAPGEVLPAGKAPPPPAARPREQAGPTAAEERERARALPTKELTPEEEAELERAYRRGVAARKGGVVTITFPAWFYSLPFNPAKVEAAIARIKALSAESQARVDANVAWILYGGSNAPLRGKGPILPKPQGPRDQYELTAIKLAVTGILIAHFGAGAISPPPEAAPAEVPLRPGERIPATAWALAGAQVEEMIIHGGAEEHFAGIENFWNQVIIALLTGYLARFLSLANVPRIALVGGLTLQPELLAFFVAPTVIHQINRLIEEIDLPPPPPEERERRQLDFERAVLMDLAYSVPEVGLWVMVADMAGQAFIYRQEIWAALAAVIEKVPPELATLIVQQFADEAKQLPPTARPEDFSFLPAAEVKVDVRPVSPYHDLKVWRGGRYRPVMHWDEYVEAMSAFEPTSLPPEITWFLGQFEPGYARAEEIRQAHVRRMLEGRR